MALPRRALGAGGCLSFQRRLSEPLSFHRYHSILPWVCVTLSPYPPRQPSHLPASRGGFLRVEAKDSSRFPIAERIPINSHRRIPELRDAAPGDFPKPKREVLVLGVEAEALRPRRSKAVIRVQLLRSDNF